MTNSAFEAVGSRVQSEFRHARFAGDVEPEMSCTLAGYGVDVSDFPSPPPPIDLTADIFSGGSVSGIVCFVAPVASPSFVLYATADFSARNTMFATSGRIDDVASRRQSRTGWLGDDLHGGCH